MNDTGKKSIRSRYRNKGEGRWSQFLNPAYGDH